ncbi:uncharacterized protein LOC116182258 [Photinus pyralis]|uniref:uncharacterized protein LOC116179085 n=1 Tax=Photinus pyralis TaxID=7054 RepID=UPI00126713CA|nr:uncharacterized protein LOC116179085 [Photinus pyralis]XP_031358639.1 uncharacterized protein LOC116182258 [Photinus pyralis]
MTNRYTEGEQSLILKLIQYFQGEKEAGKTLTPVSAVYDRVCAALGVSLWTVKRISTRGVKKDDDYKSQKSVAISLSHGPPLHEIHEHVIRTRIYAMYATVIFNDLMA